MTPSARAQGHALEAPLSADRTSPLVVSVVVNYCGFDDTMHCVESLLASVYARHLVVVVDNASTSGDAARLTADLGDRVHVIASGTNLGYGGGANLGLRWALDQSATYAWVLNNDTIVEPACIGQLVDAMQANPRTGALSPQIEAPVGPEAPLGIWFAGGKVLLDRAETQHSFERVVGAGILETEYITGCAMFLRSAALADTGLFWEPLFLYWEDLDLSLRMRRAGWNLGVLPNARIQHTIHGSVGSNTLDYYHFRNALVIVRTFGSRRAVASALLFVVGGVARRWGRALLRRKPAPTGATRGLLVGIWLAVRWPTKVADRAR
ncbi:MAG TPA: glycosyltransferase family 2 protein [Candidatus Limnocylindrales bacterium]